LLPLLRRATVELRRATAHPHHVQEAAEHTEPILTSLVPTATNP